MKYVVLFTDKDLPSEQNHEVVYEGEFSTIKEAEAHIRKDALDCANGGFENGDEEWGGRYTILQVVKTLQPVPTVKITLKEVGE